MDGVWRYVDHVARFPVVTLDLLLRLPVIRVGDLDVAVLVQVVAMPLDDVEAFLGEVAMLSGAAAGRNDLHVRVHRFHARVHRLVDEVLEQPLPRHLPGHILGMHELLPLGVSCRRRSRIVEQPLIELLIQRAFLPRLRFTPGHVRSLWWTLPACALRATAGPPLRRVMRYSS